MDNKHILVLDLDGVIFNSLKLIDMRVKAIDERATDSYLARLIERSEELQKELYQLEYERVNDCDDIKADIMFELEKILRLRREHFDLKDIVLEEVFDEYRDAIDYHNIYLFKNTFPGVVETIWRIWSYGAYDCIIGESHYNSESECLAKKYCLEKHLPMIEFLPVKFHMQPYFNPVTGEKNLKRIRTNKIDSLKKYLGTEDLTNVSFIDDSISIIREAEKAHVGHCYHKDAFDDINELLRKAYSDTCDDIRNENVKNLRLKR